MTKIWDCLPARSVLGIAGVGSLRRLSRAIAVGGLCALWAMVAPGFANEAGPIAGQPQNVKPQTAKATDKDFAASGSESDKPSIIDWYLSDMPPAQIRSGKSAGQGYADRATWLVVAEIPGFRHRLKVGNPQRIRSDVESKPNACVVGMIRTPEREAVLLFSEPVGLVLANAVVMAEGRAGKFADAIQPDGSIQLEKALQSGGKLLVRQARSYGEHLDGLVDQAKKANQLLTLPASMQAGVATLSMLVAGRADMAFLYPIEFEFALREESFQQGFNVYPVAGNVGYALYHAACAKSSHGEKVVAAVNAIVSRHREGVLAQGYRNWLPSSSLAGHAELHAKVFYRPPQTAEPNSQAAKLDAIAKCLQSGGVWEGTGCDQSP